MVDTIAFNVRWPLKPEFAKLPKYQLVRHKKARYTIREGAVVRVEASLPRLLFGNNSRLPSSQAEINDSLNRLRDEAAEIADLPPAGSWPLPVRIDLAWQIDVEETLETTAQALILALSGLSIPMVRNGATLYSNCEGVSWRGSKSRFMLTIYNKSKENRLPGHLVRAEVRLVGAHVSRHLNADNWRDADALRSCYREIMTKVPVVSPCSAVLNWRQAVGLEGAVVANRILARLQPDMNPRTFRRHRAEVNAANCGNQSWPRMSDLFSPISHR